MVKNIKIHNNLDIIEISKSIELNKCTHKKNSEKIYLNVSYDFLKFWWVQENQGVTFLMVPPKDGLAHT